MENIKNFFANKRAGYFIAIADALLAIVLAIVFFATYSTAMANNAVSHVPESIGIFLIAGAVIEIVALLLPEYLIIHAVALVFYCLAMMKEVYLIPNLIADEVNDIHYQGGNLKINILYLVVIFIIIFCAIVALFLGFAKKEGKGEMSLKKDGKVDTKKVIRVSSGAAVGIAAILVSVLVVNNMQSKINQSQQDTPDEPPVVKPSPADRFKEAAEAYQYDFVPEDKLLKEGWYEAAHGNPVVTNSQVGTGATRDGHYLVYRFEGSYAEGWQGDYSLTYADLYLWDDGLFGGHSGSTNFIGYWYNVSADATEEKSDCLNMVYTKSSTMASAAGTVETIETYEESGFKGTTTYQRVITDDGNGTKTTYGSIDVAATVAVKVGDTVEVGDAIAYNLGNNICAKTTGYYSWIVDLDSSVNQGRRIKSFGYYYYPAVGMFIDTAGANLEYNVGEKLDRSMWRATGVLKNLKYSAVFKDSEVKWTDPDMSTPGTKEVKATWTVSQGVVFEDTVQITVKDPNAPAEPASEAPAE